MAEYIGTIVEESLKNPNILDELTVVSSEISPQLGWHIRKVKIMEADIEKLSGEINDKKWYMHFWSGREVIAVFKDETFRFNYDDKESWTPAIEYGLSIGIPKEQLDFPIE